ncbi:CRISPR-associated protein Csy2 [Oceanospirillum multiglobuliferum]|uniref:Type I-F CRISPR-associated protein Csy2 n=1 Tax=Oceanospirillum multiglobuliferum TaxID=64969 RepID=A0A1T4P2E6_9GAMM|nr:type I-F CRISPR-associated protein Csy2 [Oceanospirillum multiglobuliferum]OPX55108.1 type I-F CRISPR-associated protein Csy2 [Oceanospirillum multiglobuliferum]SJZ85581.1 CRISPR-associated protein Csy2 [Oceanospirillum multiglobuliferum]
MSTRRFLVLPHLKVHNANALSSPFTIGFPAMTAWLGFVHALQRNLTACYPSLQLIATGVISHQCDLQTYQGPGDFVHSIIGTGNPLDKEGNRSAFIEEARCHLDVSLLIEYQANEHTQDLMNQPDFSVAVSQQLMRMKVAGGDLQRFNLPMLQVLDDSDEQAQSKLMRSFMPGFALIERRELLQHEMEQGLDALDGILEYLTVHHTCTQDDDGNIHWKSQRKVDSNGKKPGWIVPIATGFQGISELGQAKNQRDSDLPHRFAESIVTLGEFRMAHRIKQLDEVLWHYHADLSHNLYLCQQIQTTEIDNDGFY